MLKEKLTIKSLYERYSQDVLRYAFSILRNIDEAEDVKQEVFLKYQLSQESYNRECNYKTWLFTITRNLCYNKLKEARRKDYSIDTLEFQETYQHRFDESIMLEQAVNTLTPAENELIFLRDFENYSYKELAEIFEISVDNIKVRLFRAKKKLKKLMS